MSVASITDDVVAAATDAQGVVDLRCQPATPEHLAEIANKLALQALGEQNLKLRRDISELRAGIDRAQYKLAGNEIAIAVRMRRVEGTFHGDGFDIKPRRAVSRTYPDMQLSPSQRRAARRNAIYSDDAAYRVKPVC